jgi:hypothetical protein
MLMEKQDMLHLKLKMLLLKEITINNSHLPHFKKTNGFQPPDFILEYYLHEYYKQQGFNNPEVYVESYVA